jgi:hypothetical protein
MSSNQGSPYLGPPIQTKGPHKRNPSNPLTLNGAKINSSKEGKFKVFHF